MSVVACARCGGGVAWPASVPGVPQHRDPDACFSHLRTESKRLRDAIAHHHKHARQDGHGVRAEDRRLYAAAGIG